MAIGKVMYLRPHHGLCIQHYVGKGYDDSFVENMNHIVEHLQQNPKQMIILQTQNDVLCDCCPNLRKSVCLTEGKIKQIDERVLALCGYSCGQEVMWSEYQSRIVTEIILPGKLKESCNECEWLSLCEDITKSFLFQP